MPNPLEGARVRRSEYLADALQALQSQGQQSRTPGALGANLLASYLLNRQNNRALEEEQRAAEEADKPRREALANLMGAFGGGQPAMPGQPQAVAMNAEGGGIAPIAPQGGTQGPPSLSDPNFVQSLVAAELAGVDGVSNIVRALQAGQPDIAIGPDGRPYDARNPETLNMQFRDVQPVNNMLVDVNDPENVDRYIPTLPEGAVPQMQGRDVVGVQALPGYTDVIGGRARAEADARQAAEASYAGVIAEQSAAGAGRGGAPYQTVTVQGPDGQPITMSLQALLEGGGISGQTREEAAAAEVAGRTGAEREADMPRAQAYMADADRRTGIVIDALDQAIQLASPEGLFGFSGETGVVGAAMQGVPGTRAYDLRRTIDTILGNVGFDELQTMRDNSPTGGALGQVAVREIELLQALRGSLDQGQSQEQFLANATRILSELRTIQRQRQEAFAARYGQGGAQTGAPARLRFNPATGDFD
jgi:hypothetical protein